MAAAPDADTASRANFSPIPVERLACRFRIMSKDLSDWTKQPDPWRDALIDGGIVSIGMIPIVGPLAAGAVQATLTHKQNIWITEGFSRTAARVRALEDRPTPEQMLASDEFTAACAATV